MSLLSLVRRRIEGEFEIDEWGLDAELVEALSPLVGLRWSIDARGADHLPAEGPAVLVFDRPRSSSAPLVVGRAVRVATGRSLRFAGLPDVVVVGPVLRRVGAVLGSVDEIASVLRAGHLVGAGVASQPALAAAAHEGVPVVPVGLVGNDYGRKWEVVFGAEDPG